MGLHDSWSEQPGRSEIVGYIYHWLFPQISWCLCCRHGKRLSGPRAIQFFTMEVFCALASLVCQGFIPACPRAISVNLLVLVLPAWEKMSTGSLPLVTRAPQRGIHQRFLSGPRTTILRL